MVKLIIRRILMTIPLLFLVTVIVFSLSQLVPGDPAVTLAGESATKEQIIEIRDKLGFDDPLVVQYGHMVKGLATGDLGTSLYSTQTVTAALGQALPVTLSLAALALVLVIIVGVSFGILAGMRPGSILDRMLTLVASLGVAAPAYWVGMILVIIFTFQFDLLPGALYVSWSDSKSEWLRHLILPAFALALAGIVEVTRQLRGSLRDTMQLDYIRTARAKGMRQRTVVMKHGLKNAAIPVVTVIGLQVNALLGGAIAVEQVFGFNGIGQLAVKAVRDRDLPVMQGIVLVSVVVVTVSNLLVDLAYGYLNPRVRAS
ncbi:MAG: ABC transporter permease [Ilumatobacteraceae bacterium]